MWKIHAFRRLPSGSLILKLSPEALTLSAPGASGGNKAPFRARKPGEVEEAARAHIIATGGDPGNVKLRELEASVSEGPQMANKDGLTRYACAYPDFMELVRFHKVQEEARSLASQPGQEGATLVGFGKYKADTLRDLYSLEDKSKIT
ncbi:hypothetical protein ANANG_G00283740 [Anguilla anguilla]|uniref:Uncharacterized protein n=1 Tax=Anguilla anguilla TaxID=7936 RepID=A0A9D3RJ19_ANGAN|nr:hypothetical protein ANANG_G00283740 [Anguilla anguilla]